MITFEEFLLLEGGAAGHMAHPFDLASVRTGKDLINFFKKAGDSVERNKTQVKFDGLNVSLKLVVEDGRYRFALDRGSNKPIDNKGITADNIEERFDKGHGMISVGKFILGVMDSAFDTIKTELKMLGLFDSSKFLNTEYITKLTNVTEYDRNMIVFHGVNEFFYEKSPLRKSTRRSSREISYNKKALDQLVAKLKPIFMQHDFEVFGPTRATGGDAADYNSALNSTLGIVYNGSDVQTRSLKGWLESAKNPSKIFVRNVSNKKMPAMSKSNYLHVLAGKPIASLVGNNPEYQKAVADGAIFYHATRMLGNTLLKTLGSEAGELAKHEGIVIRDARVASVPEKITGEFIVKGMSSQFQKSENEEGIGGLIGALNYANSTGDYMQNKSYLRQPPYGSPPNVGASVG